MKPVTMLAVAFFIPFLPGPSVLADWTPIGANPQSGESLVACSGTGHSVAFYCDWDGCVSVDEGVLEEGSCAKGPFDMDEANSNTFVEDSWGRVRLQELATEKGPDETIVLHAVLPADSFDITSLSMMLTASDRAAKIQERKEDLAPIQELAETLVEDVGGIVLRRTWLVPGVIIEIPAVASMPLLDDALFVDLVPASEIPDTPGAANEGWGGLDITNGTLSEDLYQLGYMGEEGGRTTTPMDNIKIGISEVNDPDTTYPEYLNCDHVGWHDWYATNPPTRLKKAEICDSSSCSGSACDSTYLTHSTRVAWAAAGSIEQQQDQDEDGAGPDVGYMGVHTTEQRRRSGVASEANVYFYYITGSCGKLTAIEQAVEDGVDVYNMSWKQNVYCNLTYDSCSLNAAIESAADAGVIVVGISGNSPANPSNGYCSVTWPGIRSSVMSVNGLASQYEGTPYEDLDQVTWTSTGSSSIQVTGGGTRVLPHVDIEAPGAINWYFSTGDDNYGNNSYWGTSYAAPIISGIAGLTREWMKDLGWTTAAANSRLLMTNLLVMGDGHAGVLGFPEYEFDDEVSRWTGYGRIRAHLPVGSSIGSGMGWATGYHWLSTGTVRYHAITGNPQSSNVEGVKVAVAWYDSDFQGVGDLKVQIVDMCPVGGGEEVIATAEVSQTMRKRIQLTQDDDIHGRCLYLRMEGLAASGEMYYYAMYTYGNSEVLH